MADITNKGAVANDGQNQVVSSSDHSVRDFATDRVRAEEERTISKWDKGFTTQGLNNDG